MSEASEDKITLGGKVYTVAELLKEQDDYIRLEAAERCFALTALVNDHSMLVRSAVARKKIGHEILVKDLDWQVRATVARYCSEVRFLDMLAQDIHEFVRFIVVKRGHALEQFVEDKDEEIAAIARYSLQQQRIWSEYVN